MKKIACVIIPLYHGTILKELVASIDSVMNQDFTGFDIIIISDGTLNPDVRNFIKKLILIKNNIKKIQLKNNYGLAYAMNIGIRKAQHKYIIRQDSDTVSHKSRFKMQIEYLENNPDLDLIGSFMLDITTTGKKYIQKMPLDHINCYNTFRYRNPLNHPTVVFRNTFFEKAGLYPIEYYRDEDSALWLNGFLNGCKFSNLEKVLVENKLDRDLYKRRKEFKGIVSTFKNRIRIVRGMKYPLVSYFFIFVRFFVMLMPAQLLEKFYLMRNSTWSFLSYE